MRPRGATTTTTNVRGVLVAEILSAHRWQLAGGRCSRR